jgi:hypothetical protein
MKNIKGKFGCEIECYYKYDDDDKVRELCRNNNWKLGEDGSVSTSLSDSKTAEIKVGVYDFEKIPYTEIAKLFKLVHVNSSCGLHFHLSFENPTIYYKLFSWKFVEKFQKELLSILKSAREKERVNGSYCSYYRGENEFEDVANNQIEANFKTGSRYKAVNFNAYNLYGTFEFRIFAATNTLVKFKRYIKFLFKQINEYTNQVNKMTPIKIEGIVKVKKVKPILIKEIIKKEKN